MTIIYKIFFLYPYWLLKTLIKMLSHFIKSIFFFQVDEKKIDQLSGIEFEQFIKKLLIKNGYHHVRTTVQSGDYGIDILARKNHLNYGFQCKRYQRNIGVDAIQQAKAGQLYYQLDQSCVITNSYFTSSAFALAKANDIRLIDRTQLIKMMKKAKLFSSRIPFYDYMIVFIMIISSYYLSIDQHLEIFFYLLIISILLLFFMIIKSIYYRTQNKQTHYQIHEYK